MDHAATVPPLLAMRKAMELFEVAEFGNAGSLHGYGQRAIAVVDGARAAIARAVGAEFENVIFTGSATEANNLFLRGAVKKWKVEKKSVPKILISAIEHDSVLETARDLEREGVVVSAIPVDTHGVVDIKKLEQELTPDVAAVSVMYVSNEIGTIQPIAAISKLIEDFKQKNLENGGFSRKDGVSLAQPLVRPLASRPRSSAVGGHRARSDSETLFLENPPFLAFPFFHTDAAQAFRYLECDMKKLGVDAMTLSAHKIGGPKGVGALCVSVKLPPLITGGGQEFGLRAGTENVAGIAGFAAAVREAVTKRKGNAKKVYLLRAAFASGLRKIIPDILWNGPDWDNAGAARFTPHILNAFFPAHLAEELLVRFDRAGIAVSSGSACSARASKLSHVLAAIGCTTDRIQCSVRFGFGPELTSADIQEALRRIGSAL